MSPDPDRLLAELPAALPLGFTLLEVTDWVARGRPRRRFHALVWLSRVIRWPLN